MTRPPSIPRATYRLQLNRDFGFAQAAALVPYLHALGISHVYCSPYLKARAGSTHGYDIVDHNAINPELGTPAEFERFTATLAEHGMGQILDLVPNHMGIGGADNPWWLDVLEHGPASMYADFFDIDWQPAKPELAARVLVPLLEDHYGKVLEAGLLRLQFDAGGGTFTIAYHEHRFPIDPRTYASLLAAGHEALMAQHGPDHPASRCLHERTREFEALPARWMIAPDQRLRRQSDQASDKLRLARDCREHPEVHAAIRACVQAINGESGTPSSFDRLHELLEQQAYRLAYWRVAADEINYRRFFDINTLAGLRMEKPEVFDATHQLVLTLVRNGHLHGLRLDHPDGLFDPAQYYAQLRTACRAAAGGDAPPLYTVAEKILAWHEQAPEDWPVHGTTGYEFAVQVNGLFVDASGEHALTRLYRRFTGETGSFDDLVYESKKRVMHTLLSGELQVLANQLDRLSEADRGTRDYTLATLREALTEFIASLPVYRTYLGTGGASEQDRRYILRALAAARRRRAMADATVFDFLAQLFARAMDEQAPAIVPFVMKLQQYCAPVMAKGLEDTSLYLFNRLVSLNEVGGDPRRFGVTIEDFHRDNEIRRRCWPHNLLATSTHDTKRSEDVRARINVLSEIPEHWRQRVGVWSRLTRRFKRDLDGKPAPSRNDEYLFYQTLIGAWPLDAPEHGIDDAFRARIDAFMLKAVREGKRHSSWLNPDSEYESALTAFVHGALGSQRFLDDFRPFQARIARDGLYNSLGQTLIKLTAPGVPDIYQGTELWDDSLVDPDNRRPVDYGHRHSLLQGLMDQSARADIPSLVASLRATIEDGRTKLWLILRALSWRAREPELFRDGDYRPLALRGRAAANAFAYARVHGTRQAITVVSRGLSRLRANPADPLPDAASWHDTQIAVPPGHGRYDDLLTGRRHHTLTEGGENWLDVGELLRDFPVALLENRADDPDGPPNGPVAQAT